MSLRALVDGIELDVVSLRDRGLAYGDGVFETMRAADGRLPWWGAHHARLVRGCERLGITVPDAALLESECLRVCAGHASAVVKLVVTRGASGRGYATSPTTAPTRIVSLHPAPILEPLDYEHGVALHACRTALAIQPRLAGIKHLNRLEQVLARAEWDSADIGEGLMQDMDGRIVAATAANLFFASQGRWFTPELGRCGIEGICRGWVIGHFPVEVIDVAPQRLLDADELFLSSSLRGILPVARYGGRRWNVGPMTRIVQQTLWKDVPALDPHRDASA